MKYKKFYGVIYLPDPDDTYLEDQLAYYSCQTGGTIVFTPIEEEDDDQEKHWQEQDKKLFQSLFDSPY